MRSAQAARGDCEVIELLSEGTASRGAVAMSAADEAVDSQPQRDLAVSKVVIICSSCASHALAGAQLIDKREEKTGPAIISCHMRWEVVWVTFLSAWTACGTLCNNLVCMQNGGNDKIAFKNVPSATKGEACPADCKDSEQHCSTSKVLPEPEQQTTEPEPKRTAHNSSNAEAGTSIKQGLSSIARSEAPRHASSEALAQLTAMGFSEMQARSALQATSNSLERAANWLLLGQKS